VEHGLPIHEEQGGALRICAAQQRREGLVPATSAAEVLHREVLVPTNYATEAQLAPLLKHSVRHSDK
jgi:hypothetical protein